LQDGRWRGYGPEGKRRAIEALYTVRDRILDAAVLSQGDKVADVGAGTGLLADEVARRVGPTGLSIALDISEDALQVARTRREGGRNSSGPEESCGPVCRLVADVHALPLGGEVLDGIVGRAVLMYLSDRQRAVREMFRVLRPSGNLVICEPVRGVCSYERSAWDWANRLGAIEAAHRSIVDRINRCSTQATESDVLTVDELTSLFVSSGFRTVAVTVGWQYDRARLLTAEEIKVRLYSRQYPGAISYREATQDVLGGGWRSHLLALTEVLSSNPVQESRGLAYLVARR
jgi:ubiquinone/menaquinone biosynthesis C-methylase UbiE